MKPYKEYLEAAGNILEYLTPDYFWVAYKNGEVSKHFTKEAAFAVSSNCEKIESEESILKRKLVHDHNNIIDRKAYDAWYIDLRNAHVWMNDKLFSVILDAAYNNSHAYGHDAVAEKFATLAELAKEIIDATK